MREKAAEGRGLYRPEFEHDACGIGAVVDIQGRASHETVDDALKIVEKLEHRLALDGRGMRERRAQQHLVIELIAQNLLGVRESFRQSQDLGLLGVFDRVDGVGDRVERQQGLVIDFEVELVLDGRHQLQTQI